MNHSCCKARQIIGPYSPHHLLLLQEASQLLTILQGLQPPLKLDGKTIGVDYAKSARKYVNYRISDCLVTLL